MADAEVKDKMEEVAPGAPPPAPVVVGNPESTRAQVAEKLSHPARLLRSLFSARWKEEAKELAIISWPIVLANLLFFTPILVSLIFAGSRGTETMDAAALALTFVNLTGTSVGMGLTTALDTLLSQCYGGANKKRMGVIVQRGVLIIMMFCFPCWALYINIEGVMLLLGEPPDVSKMGGEYVLVFIPGLPGMILIQILFKYLQNQNIVMAPMLVAVFMNIINVVYHAIIIIGFNLPPRTAAMGAAGALALAYWSANIALMLWIWFKVDYKQTWTGWSLDCLQEWGSFTKLAIPGLLMMALEFWNYEIGTLLSGRLGKKPLAAQAIMYQFCALAVMLPFGVAVAASIRVGQHLGHANAEMAKVAARLCICFTVFTALLTLTLYTSLRWVLPRLFSNDNEVIKKCAFLFILVSISSSFDAIQQVCSGVLRGCGRQKIGAFVNFIGFYVIGLPIGLSLMLRTKLGVAGYWTGTILGTATQAITFNVIIAFTKWDKEVVLAQKRAGIAKRMEEIDKGFVELSSRPKHYSKEGDTVEIEGEDPTIEAKKARKEKEKEKEPPTIVATDISDGAIVTTGDVTSDTEVIIQTDEEAPATLKRLPMKTLLIRRSLVLLAMFGILMVGIIIRLAVPLPHPKTNSTHREGHHTAPAVAEAIMSAMFGPIVPHDQRLDEL